jgi:uncharacterized protein
MDVSPPQAQTADASRNGNQFLSAARPGENDFWRYLLTMFTILVGFVMAGVIFAAGAMFLSGDINIFTLPPHQYLVVNLLPFLAVLVILWLSLRLLHRRPFFTLINPGRQFNWRRLFLSGSLWIALSLASDAVLSLLQPGNYTFKFEPALFWPWLVVSVVFLPFQCAAEELTFRSYLAQGIGLRGGFWLAWLFPSILFGLLHGANPEVGVYGIALTLPMYVGTGLLLGWLTLQSESVELALGLHIANNLYGALLVTFPSSVLPAPALFRIQEYDGLAVMIAFSLSVVIYLLLLRLFGRSFFRKGLLRPIL